MFNLSVYPREIKPLAGFNKTSGMVIYVSFQLMTAAVLVISWMQFRINYVTEIEIANVTSTV